MADRSRVLIAAGAFLLLLATAFGAYGTHALAGNLDDARWSAFQVAVDYQFYHGLGVMAVALASARFPDSKLLALSGWVLFAGTILFCGSVYGAALGTGSFITALAPMGGLTLMLGWLLVGVGALRAH